MIQIHRVHNDDDNNAFGLYISGHANFADKGKDIVCSAVSALIQTIAVNLDDITNYYDVDYSSEDHTITYIYAVGRDIKILCDAVMKTLRMLAEEYPDNLSVADAYDDPPMQ